MGQGRRLPTLEELYPGKRIDSRYEPGTVFRLTGNSKDLWIYNYNTQVNSYAEVMEQPFTSDKKVLVRIAEINNKRNVCAYVKKQALLPA